MLRTDSTDQLAPQPMLADLPRLTTQVREAGLPVEFQVDGERRDLPVGIELSAYRIVQEALTNVLKHAGQAHAAVHVRYGPDAWSWRSPTMEPTTKPCPPPRLPGGGHGLAGIRERVSLYGGTFDASAGLGGGFAVRVLRPSGEPPVTTVLIADDQALVRVGLRKILENERDTAVIGEAGDGQDAVAVARRTRPDVVLMDIRMPVLDGIEATRRIVAAQPATRVLILTTFGLDDYVYAALRAGASGFMLKDAPPRRSPPRSGSWLAARRCSRPPSPARSSRSSPASRPGPARRSPRGRRSDGPRT